MASLSSYYPQPLPIGTTSESVVVATGSTTARSLANRFAERFNVKDWGLVGNGTTDDAPALRNLMNHVMTLDRAIVYFPSGRYNLGTFTDGTSTFSIPQGGNQAVKSIVYLVNNFANAAKNIIFEGDGAVIESPLWCETTNIYPFAGYVVFFYFFGAINLEVNNIEFLRKVGGVGQQPILPVSSGSFSNNGASYAFNFLPVNQFNQGDPNGTVKPKNIKINNCKFTDFSVHVNIWGADHVDITNCRFDNTWGACSSGGTAIDFTACICTRFGVDSVNISNNLFIGGPEDYTPILNTATGTFQLFRPAENAAFNIGAKKSNICNNVVKRFAYEMLVSGRSTSDDQLENIHIVNDNTIYGYAGIGANWKDYGRSGNDGIVIIGPNAVISGNSITECNQSIWISGWTNGFDLGGSNTIVANNVMNITTDPLYKWGQGMSVVFSGSANTKTSVIKISNNIFNAEEIQPYYLSDGNIPNWDGNAGTYTSDRPAFLSTPSALSIAGSGLYKTVVNDNFFNLKSKANSNLFYAAIVSDSQMELINNRVDGWDFVFFKNGGNISRFTNKGLITNNIKRLFASPTGRGSEQVCHFDYNLEFTPTETGWYRLHNSTRYSGMMKLFIQTANESFYGDSSRTDSSLWYRQNTELTLSLAGVDNTSSKLVQVVQNSHSQNANCPVTKFYFRPSNNSSQSQEMYIYVDKLTERLLLTFSGGGASVAAAGYANVSNGVIQSVTITGGGSGYTSAPTVTVAYQSGRDFDLYPVFGSGATFTASISNNQVTSVSVGGGGGSGYSQPIYIKSFVEQYSVQNPFVYEIQKSQSSPSGGLEFNFSQGFKQITYYQQSGAKHGTGIPTIATTAPVSTPEFIGQQYINTSTGIAYLAAGTSSSADWKAISFWEP